MMTFFRCAVVALMLTSSPVAAQDFDAGLNAFEAGNHASAVQEWRPLAEQGDAAAQYNLGLIYQGMTQQHTKFVRWHRKKGQGVPTNYSKAFKWYRMAAEQGNAGAQNQLGFMYLNGRGVLQDYVKAVRWFRLAAEKGNARAQYNLGVRYQKAQGVPRDYIKAHMWLNIATANGTGNATTYTMKKNRDLLSDAMSTAEISEAQSRARACVESGYQDCD